MSERITKLNKLFKEHLGEIFQRELSLTDILEYP